jgi:hypothetical protein
MPMMSFFSRKRDKDKEEEAPTTERASKAFLPDEQRANFELDIALLEDEDGTQEQRLLRVAEREVLSAAEESLKRLHVIKMGRCPVCGEHLSQHMSANICESCGWNRYDTPKSGSVRVHLRQTDATVEGDHAYVLKGGDCLVVKGDVVLARIPASSFSWVEYVWNDAELEQRQKTFTDLLQIVCGWCGGMCDTAKDGFHLVHVAFGVSQERYCFCSDECYEAFRRMYPARVHRNCYDRNCNDCNFCVKRYGDEADGIRMIAKDFLRMPKK